jgi:hypothetical protein
LYSLWKNMHARCRSAANPDYGAKGIRVCAEWSTFELFAEWARTHDYRDDLTIERRDNRQGYSPGNCLWADKAAQALNRSIVRRLPDGRAVVTVARENGIPPRVAARRIRDGWPMMVAVTHPYSERRIAQSRDSGGRFRDGIEIIPSHRASA